MSAQPIPIPVAPITPLPPPPTHDEIARVAFQIYMDTGQPQGKEAELLMWKLAVTALLKDRGLPLDTPTW